MYLANWTIPSSGVLIVSCSVLGVFLVTKVIQARKSRKLVRKQVDALPTEILRMVFRNFSNQDLGKVMLVCKRWREVGDVLWSWPPEHVLSVGRADLNMLDINRVRGFERITIVNEDWEEEDLEELLDSIMMLPKVFILNMPGIDLTSLNPDALAEIVTNKMEHVDMSHCMLTDIQLDKLFGEIDEIFELQLQISGVNLSNVDKDTLAVGVNKLVKVEMYQTQLSGEQVTSILTQAGRQTKLVQISMDSNTIEGDPFLNSSVSLFGASSITQLVDQEVVQLARQNIPHWDLKYDFDNNANWTSYRASKRIVAYVANQSL